MGKASLIYVLGLSFIVSYGLLNINAAGTDAVDNFATYYGRTLAHEIASSGANIGCSDVFDNPSYMTPYNDVTFKGGNLDVSFAVAGNIKHVTSVGSIVIGHSTIYDTVTVELRNATMAQYAWFTNLEANKGGQPTSWSTGDTAWGPIHTNDKFNINGAPVFMKKATAWKSAVPAKNSALWAGGYEWGIKIPYPTDMNSFVSAASDPLNGRLVAGHDAFLNFNPSGKVGLKVPALSVDTTFGSVSDFTANGAFAVAGANLYVQGTLNGNVAIGAIAVAGAGGNVFITGDVRYHNDPRTDPASTDELAIYAQNNIQVTYDNSNPGFYQNREVDAAIFTLTGDFEVQDAKTYAPRGTLTTYGSIMQYYRGEIGNIIGGTLRNGYFKNFRYDTRFSTLPPKYFPATGRYLLFAWREN